MKFNSKKIKALFQGKSVNQIVKKLCGELLGSGCYRDVYVLKQYPEYVVKIERDMSCAQFANVCEWRNYINNKEWKFLEPWLAPCVLINETGQILVQRRVTQDRRRKDYPKEVPVMFTDMKLRNFGWIGDRFVCCDYSYLSYVLVDTGGKKFKKAKWWGSLK